MSSRPCNVLAVFLAVFASLSFMPGKAFACFCAAKPDGTGYFCETACAPFEIEMKLGPGHAPVQMTTGYLTGNFIPPGPVPASVPGTANTGVGATPTNSPTRGGGGCFVNKMNDFICPKMRQMPPAPQIPPNCKPYIGVALNPPPFQNPQPGGTPGNPTPIPVLDATTAYTWPPGFGCQNANAVAGPPPVGQDPSLWSMTFEDEFNALDTGMWHDALWYQQPNPTQNYTVENGALKVWPQRDGSGQFFDRSFDTDGTFSQTYGYFEMEAKLPIGKGVWPAFWLFNHIGNGRPEIDIMEAYPGGGPGSGWGDANLHPIAYGATVWTGANVRAGFQTKQTPDLSAGFHVYGLQWEADKQTFYFDGQPFFVLNVSMPDPMYMILDLWFGSASGQPDNTTPEGKANSYEINYVRAWEACDPAILP